MPLRKHLFDGRADLSPGPRLVRAERLLEGALLVLERGHVDHDRELGGGRNALVLVELQHLPRGQGGGEGVERRLGEHAVHHEDDLRAAEHRKHVDQDADLGHGVVGALAVHHEDRARRVARLRRHSNVDAFGDRLAGVGGDERLVRAHQPRREVGLATAAVPDEHDGADGPLDAPDQAQALLIQVRGLAPVLVVLELEQRLGVEQRPLLPLLGAHRNSARARDAQGRRRRSILRGGRGLRGRGWALLRHGARADI
mmetsp:Transcript_17867/g.47853  ORF Transcript_17867/g.47853 Transcript_17867/m.47853 type:complete len:256 (+) Transcript_17867:1531-2298(+)